MIMGIEDKLYLSIYKKRFLNKMDATYHILFPFIYPNFLFNVEPSSTPNEISTKLEGLFHKMGVLT